MDRTKLAGELLKASERITRWIEALSYGFHIDSVAGASQTDFTLDEIAEDELVHGLVALTPMLDRGEKISCVNRDRFAEELLSSVEFLTVKSVVEESEILIVSCNSNCSEIVNFDYASFQIVGATWHGVSMEYLKNLLSVQLINSKIQAPDIGGLDVLRTGMRKEILAVEFNFIPFGESPVFSMQSLISQLGMSRETIGGYLESAGIPRAESGGGGRKWSVLPEEVVKLCDQIILKGAIKKHKERAKELKASVKSSL